MNLLETKNKLNLVANALESSHNKDTLASKFWSLSKLFVKQHKDLLQQIGIQDELLEAAQSNKSANKSLMSQICALPFLTKATYELFIKLLPKEVQILWHELIWVEKMSQSEIEKKLNFKVFTTIDRPPYYHNGPVIKTEVLLDQFTVFSDFEARSYSLNRKFILGIPLPLRYVLVNYYDKPASAQLTAYPEAPATTQHRFNGESALVHELVRAATYYSQGQIAYTGKDRPAHTTLVKMQRSLSIKEFFPDAENKKMRTLRTNFLALSVQFIEAKSMANRPIQDILKAFFKSVYPKIRLAPVALPDLKGMNYIEDYSMSSVEAQMWKLFNELPQEGWVPLKNIQEHIRYNLLDLRPISEYLSKEKLYYEYEPEESNSRYRETKHFIATEQYHQALTLSYVSGSLFFFAALGLCDLAYNSPPVDKMGVECFSSWDGLHSVRRTALGNYVCGLTNTYDVSALGTHKSITLSPETLMIVTEESDVSAAAILETYTERVGANRFRTDSQIFLKNVKSKNDLESKIVLFKQVIGSELPPNWQDFLKTLIQKINPFESPGEMYAYKIPTENKPLIQLVAQDAILKSLIIKAEGFIILVPKNNTAAFKRRLQEFGYLLT